MTDNQPHSNSVMWISLVFALLLGTTLSLFFAFAQRPYHDNSVVALCYFVLLEFLFCAAMVVSARAGRKANSASLSIVTGILYIYALLGTCTVIVNLWQPAEKQLTAPQFTLLLAAECVFFLIIAIFVLQRDKTQSMQDAKREEEDASNELPALAKAVDLLHAARVTDAALGARVDKLAREIEKLRATLKFSPPGSRGCPLAGKIAQKSASSIDEGMLNELESLVAQATSSVSHL